MNRPYARVPPPLPAGPLPEIQVRRPTATPPSPSPALDWRASLAAWHHPALRVLGFLCLLVWLFTLRAEPSPIIFIHYAALASGVGIAAGQLLRLLPAEGVDQWVRRAAIAAVVVGSVATYGPFDSYTARWTSFADDRQHDGWPAPGSKQAMEDRCEYADTTYRWSRRITYRVVDFYDPGKDLPVFTCEGPRSASGKQHGEWKTFHWDSDRTETQWYWYGEEVTEGEWRLRSR